MTRAILISGNAFRFTQEVSAMERYLVREVGIGRNQIKSFLTVRTDASVLMDMHLAMAAAQKSTYPLIVHYAGHGNSQGWSFDDSLTVGYDTVASIVRVARRPVLFVNDCCHSMHLVKEIEEAGASPNKVAVIGASECDEVTYSWLGQWLRTNWQKRRPNRLSNALHWGAALDHHFYPREADKEVTT